MSLFDKVGSFLKREAKDLGDAAESVKDKLDHELTEREEALKMTPSEKIAALTAEAAATDAKFDAIADKAAGQQAIADATAEVESVAADAVLPNVTHIVLGDGQVQSGADLDEAGPLADLPPPPAAPSAVEALPQRPVRAEAEPAAGADDLADLPPPPAAPTAPAAAAPAVDAPAFGDAPPPVADAGEPHIAQTSSSLPSLPSVPSVPAAPAEPAGPDYGKTPAQMKYEEARAAANDLLDELRGELKDDGEI